MTENGIHVNRRASASIRRIRWHDRCRGLRLWSGRIVRRATRPFRRFDERAVSIRSFFAISRHLNHRSVVCRCCVGQFGTLLPSAGHPLRFAVVIPTTPSGNPGEGDSLPGSGVSKSGFSLSPEFDRWRIARAIHQRFGHETAARVRRQWPTGATKTGRARKPVRQTAPANRTKWQRCSHKKRRVGVGRDGKGWVRNLPLVWESSDDPHVGESL